MNRRNKRALCRAWAALCIVQVALALWLGSL